MADRVVSADLGTMFFQVAEQDKDGINIKRIRNAFVELAASDDIEDTLKNNEWLYIKDGNHYYVIGEDAIKVANMFPGKVELRRPLQDGVLNKGEDKKLLVLQQLVKTAIGPADKKGKSIVTTCVSSPSADGSVDSSFHKARIMGLFKSLGWDTHVIEEGHAVILSENPKVKEGDKEIPMSGIGISFGAGRVNCVLSYRGLQVVGMSAARSGDWIDRKVADATGVPISQVTKAKETKLDFNNLDMEDDVIFALDAYYGEMIRWVFSKFAVKFAEVKSQFEAPIEVVIAGGTSMPQGFCDKVKNVIEELELPFEISGVRQASDPRDTVVKGCLTHAMLMKRKADKKEDPESALE